MAAAGQRQQAGLPAGGAGPGVAAVALSGGVVAGGRRPAGLFAARRLGAPLPTTGDGQDRGPACAPDLRHLRTGVAATWVTARGTLVVATAQRSTTALVTWRAVTRATLPSALVSLAASGFGTFGVTQVFFMTRHQLPVFTTPALLLHLLSAGLTAPSVTPHRTGVFPTRQTAVACVAARHHFLRARQRRLGLAAGTGSADGARTRRTNAIVTQNLTGVIPTGEESATHLLTCPVGAAAGSLFLLSPAHTPLNTDSGTRRTLFVTGLCTGVLFAG